MRPAILVLVLAAVSAFLIFSTTAMALEQLGISPRWVGMLVWAMFLGSFVNIPLFTIRVRGIEMPSDELLSPEDLQMPVADQTVVAINMGGAVFPALFSVYLLVRGIAPPAATAAATVVVGYLSFRFSMLIGRRGLGLPILLAPTAAALFGLLIDPEHAAPLAYVSGTLGVLIGADVMNLRKVAAMRPPVMAIGGAGTFDGVFLTGIFAVALTEMLGTR